MSTSYYVPCNPITSMRAKLLGYHVHLSIWINHGKSGTLVLNEDEYNVFINNLKGKEIAHTHYGGNGVGRILTIYDKVVETQTLISEYGDITYLKDVVSSSDKIVYGMTINND